MAKEAGAEISAGHAESITWEARSPDYAWRNRIAVPFSYAASKNHIWNMHGRGGHVFMRAESRGMRNLIAAKLRETLRGVKIVQNKLWIDIYAQKPNHKGDAVNVVDLVCDAVKDATGLDDRWYSIRCVDWQIVKRNPRLFIGIGQEDVGNVQACSACGRLLPFDGFGKKKGNLNGIERVCRECRVAGRRLAKERRVSLSVIAGNNTGTEGK